MRRKASSSPDAEIEELRVAVQQLISANAQKDEQIEQLRHVMQAHTREGSMMRSVSAYNTAQATLPEHREAKVNETIRFFSLSRWFLCVEMGYFLSIACQL